MVTTAGFNALLKIVEEPPEHLIFVFATTEPEKVLPTIRSRTHHYPFRLLAPRTMRALLGAHLRAGGRDGRRRGVPAGDPGRRRLAARHAVGARPAAGRRRTATGSSYQRALALLGATDVALIDDAVDALAAGDAAALFGAVEAVIDAGHDPRRFATDLLERFRDLIVLQSVPDAVARGVVDAPEDVLERMRDQADADRHRDADPLRRGGARRAGRDARRHRTAAAARGGVRAAAAAVGQRHRVGAAAARRTHRDPAGHVDSRGRDSVRRRAAPPKQFARRRHRPRRADRRRPRPTPRPSRVARAEARARADGSPSARAAAGRPRRAAAGRPAGRSRPTPSCGASRGGRTRTRRRCAACGRRCARRSVSAAAPPR